MTAVTIEYCVPCGFSEQALAVQMDLLDRFGRHLEAVTLRPSHGGVFEVIVDGETVWDRDVHGTDPDRDAIADAVVGEEQTLEGNA